MRTRAPGSRSIHIGLVNNMPDAALEATERQFLSLLRSGAHGVPVHFSLYALPGAPRAEAARRHIEAFYKPIGHLWNSRLDGLIVTGAEPKAADLRKEAFWEDLTEVFDWAEHNTSSTICSCLAAHAAVEHLDGIRRRRLPAKRVGIFECIGVADHPLVDELTRQRVPHSRWNDVPESDLADCGYRVLTRVSDGGVDSFVKQRKSLFVFFQGHPEYETKSLWLECRRDFGRYLRRQTDTPPTVPHGYFDASTEDLLLRLRERAVSLCASDPVAELEDLAAMSRIANTWRASAAQLYANWILWLAGHSTGIPEQQDRDLPCPLKQHPEAAVRAAG